METQPGEYTKVKTARWVWSLGYSILLFGMSLLGDAPASKAPNPWQIGEESEVVLEGDSTVKAWECRASGVVGELVMPLTPSQIEQALNAWKTVPQESMNSLTNRVDVTALPVKVKLGIKVEDLKSGNHKMERDLRNALDAEHHPWVTFDLLSLEKISFNEKEPVFHTLANLTMAGVTRELSLDFTLKEHRKDMYFMESKRTISMKAFGISPPSALFGLLKADDEVTVTYRLQILYNRKKESGGK